MAHDIDHLRREIEELERQIASHPFEGLFDRRRLDQMQDKLKKKRKELVRLESGDDLDHEHVNEHIDIPGVFSAAEHTPDMGPDMPVDMDLDLHPLLKPSVKTAAKKTAAKFKPTVKASGKRFSPAKSKPKPKPKAKSPAKKASKKKSKR